MFKIILGAIISALRSHRALALENLALRHQLNILQRHTKKPRFQYRDRLQWVILARIWNDWRMPLTLVRPETVIRWHKKGFRYYWRWKSRSRWRGRPRVSKDLRELIRKMSRDNPLWGAPRIHGELLKLGIEVSPATVSKYMARHRNPPSQSWRTFLKNHARDIVSIDFFIVPTATFRVIYVFLVLLNDRREIVHFNVTDSPVASEKSIRLAAFEVTPFILYHSAHAQNHFTRNYLGVEVASCACTGKPRATPSTKYITKTYEEATLPESRQAPMGHSRENLERLENALDTCPARDRHPLA